MLTTLAMTKPATAMPTVQSGHAQGMIIMSIGMLILPMIDGIGKYLSMEEAMSPGQVAFYRFLLQTLFTLVLVAGMAGAAALRPKRFWLNFVRGVLLGAASLLFFSAVKYMPIADALAIFFVEPFILTALSAMALGERVGWRRWTAIGIGFVGAMIVIQPSFARFGPVALYPLGTAALFALYMLLNRALGANDKPMVMQLIAGIGGSMLLAVCLGVGAARGIGDLRPSLPGSMVSVWLVLLLGVTATLGHVLVVQAFQKAPASLLAPFQYLEIISAVIIGYLIFDDVLSPSKWLGIAIIVSSGLFIFRREQELREG